MIESLPHFHSHSRVLYLGFIKRADVLSDANNSELAEVSIRIRLVRVHPIMYLLAATDA